MLRPFQLFLLVGLLLVHLSVAQVTFSGTVRDSVTRKPLPFASVFLANTTRGTTSDTHGRYSLPNVPLGRYELTISYLGYQTRQQQLVVSGRTTQVDIVLRPTIHQLSEAVVRPNPNRESDYQLFLELFLGTSTRAKQCRVRNPDAIRVDYDAEQKVLTATVPHTLEVDNLALGYRLVFHNLAFEARFIDQRRTVTTFSHLAFQPLPGGPAQQRQWATNRQVAYQGSRMHFLRSVYTNTVQEAGFEVQRLRRVPNHRRAIADSLRVTMYAARSIPDSILHLLAQPRTLSYLSSSLLPTSSFRHVAGSHVWLRFQDLLAITYLRAKPDANYHHLSLTLIPGREQASILYLNQVSEAELTATGEAVVPLALFCEDYWAFEQMGDLLPLDYEPASERE